MVLGRWAFLKGLCSAAEPPAHSLTGLCSAAEPPAHSLAMLGIVLAALRIPFPLAAGALAKSGAMEARLQLQPGVFLQNGATRKARFHTLRDLLSRCAPSHIPPRLRRGLLNHYKKSVLKQAWH